MALSNISGEARVIGTPELTFTPNGLAKLKMRCVNSGRKLDEQTKEWKDVDTTWFDLIAWRGVAENGAEDIKDKDIITFTGKLVVRDYETAAGAKGKAVEVKVESLAISIPSQVTAKPAGQPQAAAPQGYAQQNPYGQQNPYAQQQPGQQQNPYAQPQAAPAQGYAQPQQAQQPPMQQQPPVQQQMQQPGQPQAANPWDQQQPPMQAAPFQDPAQTEPPF